MGQSINFYGHFEFQDGGPSKQRENCIGMSEITSYEFLSGTKGRASDCTQMNIIYLLKIV